MKKMLFILFVIPFAKIQSSPINCLLPRMNDTLNFTQIMFEFSDPNWCENFTLEIATDSINFQKELIVTKKTNSLAVMIDGLKFGKKYFWRVNGYNKQHKLISQSAISQFFIGLNKWANDDLLKHEVKILNAKSMYKSLVVFDYGVIANKKGETVWYLPQSSGNYRNMNLNLDGRLTFLNLNEVLEVNLNGKINWQAPLSLSNNIDLKNYHHDIKKLKNGHFICIAEKKTLEQTDKIFSVIFEIDNKNNIYWIWDEEPFFKNRKDGLFSSHINAIDYDELRKVAYISNRNSSSISKIKVGDSSYIVKQIGGLKNTLFGGQHSVSLMPNKNLLFFNNNSSENDRNSKVSSVMQIKQTPNNDTSIQVVWEYPFQFKDESENKCAKAGDVDLLPNGNFQICSGANNRVFELTPTKEIVWECKSFVRDKITDTWTGQSSYRTHFCSSLYPTYFTVQKISKSIVDNKIKFKINNDGSEPDTYQVILNGGLFTYNILPQTSKEVVLPADAAAATIEIKISSNNNPMFTRSLVFNK